jgi:Mn-dependent DtxR family transcriptional regulator
MSNASKWRPFSMMMNAQVRELACNPGDLTLLDMRLLLLMAATSDRDGYVVATGAELGKELGSNQPKISGSLSRLRRAGYVTMIKAGRYRVAEHPFRPQSSARRRH